MGPPEPAAHSERSSVRFCYELLMPAMSPLKACSPGSHMLPVMKPKVSSPSCPKCPTRLPGGTFLPLLLDPSRIGSLPGSQAPRGSPTSQASTAEDPRASVGLGRHQGWVTLCGASWACQGLEQHPRPSPTQWEEHPQSDSHRCPQMPPRVSWEQKNLLGENGCSTAVGPWQKGPCWSGVLPFGERGPGSGLLPRLEPVAP